MTLSYWQQTDQGPSIECDIAIVGGGIVGVSTAYWLKKIKPGLQVVLMEARTLGFGASGRNAGFLLQGTAVNYVTDVERYGKKKARQLWSFTQENRRLIESELLSDRIDLQPTGSLVAAGTWEENEQLIQSEALLRQAGVHVNYWDAAKIAEYTHGEDFHGALFIREGACMNPLKLVREIAGTSGARIMEHHPVISLESNNNQAIVHTPRRLIKAERVFIALNAYLPQLLPETENLLRPVRAQMLATTPVSKWLPCPIYSHQGYYYMRQTRNGTILLGGARHLFEKMEVGYDDRTTPEIQQALEDYFTTHFPGKGPLFTSLCWSGTMAFTEDGLPILAPLSELPGSYWAAGFNGHGMGYGFRFGRLVAHLYTNSELDATYRNLFEAGRGGKQVPEV